MEGLSPRSLFDLSAAEKVRIYTGGNNERPSDGAQSRNDCF
jgi:hypothetical protein